MSKTTSWLDAVFDHVHRIEDELIHLREQLHRSPELSNQEYETTRRLHGVLAGCSNLQQATPSEGRGVLCDFRHGEIEQRLALRADIDALPLQDGKETEYRSQVDQVMHACGHDVHSTILVGAMRVFAAMAEADLLPWPIRVRGIFQPAEELATGACFMIKHNAIEDCNHIVALHVDPSRSVGTIGVREGNLTANCDLFDVHFQGRGGHGARPWQTIDPIRAATKWIQRVYDTVPPDGPETDSVISFGTIRAGNTGNVIPDEAHLSGSLRCIRRDQRQRILTEIHQIGETLHDETGCVVDWKLGCSAPSVINDSRLTSLIQQSAALVIGGENVEQITNPSMGGEDFSYYLEYLPGAMFRLGTRSDQIGNHPLHSPMFDIDQRAISIGVKMLVCATIRYFEPGGAFLHAATPKTQEVTEQ